MDAPIRDVKKSSAEEGQLIVYGREQRPSVAINEELVHGALSWTNKLLLHMGSALGRPVFSEVNLPPSVLKALSNMDHIFNFIQTSEEESGEKMLQQIRSNVEEMVAKARETELRKLTLAHVKSLGEWEKKQEEVDNFISEATKKYLKDPCNIENRIDIDLRMLKAKYGFVTEEQETTVRTFWHLVSQSYGYKFFEKEMSLEALYLCIVSMDALDGSDQVYEDSKLLNPIYHVMKKYLASAEKVKNQIILERDKCLDSREVSVYNYAILRGEIMIPAIIFETIRANFEGRIVRAEEALKGFIGFVKGVAKSHIDLDKEFMEHDLKKLEKLKVKPYYSKELTANSIKSLEEAIARYRKNIQEEESITEEEFIQRALDILQDNHIINPIEAREILAREPEFDKKMFKALTVVNSLYANFKENNSVVVSDEMCVDLTKLSDPIAYFVDMLIDKDQKILALFKKQNFVEII